MVDVTSRYTAFLHELDAWTEYWDIYHPETRGRFYFGDGKGEDGLLTKFLPRERRPRVFLAWTRMALGTDGADAFRGQVRMPDISTPIMEVDALVSSVFHRHFGDASRPDVQADYLECMFRCGTDTLPPATERDARIAPDDWRKSTAGRHMIESDLMWFAWALHLEAAHAIVGPDQDHPRRALQLAGVVVGCPANFAWRGHRRTRPEYRKDDATAALLRQRGKVWAQDFNSAVKEVHALFRIREWGRAE